MSGEQILRVFVIRRWWIIASVILGAVVGSVLAAGLPRVYDARSQVIVSTSEGSDVGAAESATYLDARVPTVLEVSRSSDFANEVADDYGINRSASQVRDALDFTMVPETTVIEIRAQDRDVEQARFLANRAAETMSESFLTDRLGPDIEMDLAVLQKAESDDGAAFPDPLRFLALGALAGLVLGLLLAPIRHGFDSRVRDCSDIRAMVDADLLAARMRRPGRAIRRQISRSGAATSISGLIARLGLIGRPRGTVTMTLCGVGGTGSELAADLVETAAADGAKCALVSADPQALRIAHNRELSQVSGISVVDVDSRSGTGSVSGRALNSALPSPVEHYDLVVCISTDLAAQPEACGFLEQSDLAVVIIPPHPVRAELRATAELLRASDMEAAGFVLVDPPRRPPADTEAQNRLCASGATSTAAVDALAGDADDPNTEEFDLVPAPRTTTDPKSRTAECNEAQNTHGGKS